MIRSMTGFAEGDFESKTLNIKITIKSLNHRFLDWHYRGSQIREVENRLRTLCQKKMARGRIEVFMDLNFKDSERWKVQINEELLKKILSSMKKISAEVIPDFSFSVDNFFDIPHLIEMKRKNFTEEECRFLEKSFEMTLDQLIKVRGKEGLVLKREIRKHVQNVRASVNKIKKLAKNQPSLIQAKMKEKLEELGHEINFTEEKLIKEAAYLAQKFDLAEEIERLNCHLTYIQELLASKDNEPLGKKLDFLAQELYREANTINSKAQDIEIIKESLLVKGEVESIRQQVQNLE